MGLPRPSYCNPAGLPDILIEKLGWLTGPYGDDDAGPEPKPNSREDGVYCMLCAEWDIVGQSRYYKLKPSQPKTPSHDPMAFRYSPGFANLGGLCMQTVAASDAPGQKEVYRATKQPEISQSNNTTGLQSGSKPDVDEAQRAAHQESLSHPTLKNKDKLSAPTHPSSRHPPEPVLDHDEDRLERTVVHAVLLLWLKTHQHFCRLCHLILNSLEGCTDLESPPWGNDTLVCVERFPFASVCDLDKIRNDAEQRSKPDWSGFDTNLMGMLHQQTALREATAEAVPERLQYRFNVRLDHRKDLTFIDTRQFGIQRFEGALDGSITSSFSGLRGRRIGAGNERIRRWIDWSISCLESHAKFCSPNFICDDYPNLRLIDVRRRCIVDRLESRTYTALSYVWGAQPELVLTRANFVELHTPGALADKRENIPKTVRDVLNLCQNVSNYLRVAGNLSEMEMSCLVAWEYIWIDALCIVQDDPVDKQHHISRMVRLYSGAWQTIVAALQDGAAAGLPGVGKEVPDVEQNVEIIDGVPFGVTKPPYLTALASSQWETRWWTFQEKHISKRLLVFTDEQCFWHCSCATWCEDTNLELPDKSFPHLRTRLYYQVDPTKDPKKHFKWNSNHTDVDRYLILADSYVRRKRKYSFDGLDSIMAVLTSLIDKNAGGQRNDRARDAMSDVLRSPSDEKYFWAVPEVYLSAFLLINWSTENPWSERRAHFPTWSWLSRSLIDSSSEVVGLHVPHFKVTPREPFYRFDENGKPVMLKCVKIYKSGLSPVEDEFDHIDDKRANIPHIILVESLVEAERLNKEYQEHDTNILALHNSLSPPISHLLAFREVVCKLWVDTDPIELTQEQISDAALESLTYQVRFEESGVGIGSIQLHRPWRVHQSQWLDFVVVNEATDFESTRSLNLLLIQWDGPIARRIQALIAMKVDDTSAAHLVEKKLILLA